MAANSRRRPGHDNTKNAQRICPPMISTAYAWAKTANALTSDHASHTRDSGRSTARWSRIAETITSSTTSEYDRVSCENFTWKALTASSSDAETATHVPNIFRAS